MQVSDLEYTFRLGEVGFGSANCCYGGPIIKRVSLIRRRKLVTTVSDGLQSWRSSKGALRLQIYFSDTYH